MRVRILLLEDVPADAALIQRELTNLQKPFSLGAFAREVRDVLEVRP